MTKDDQTLEVYALRAEDYAARFGKLKPDQDLQAFIATLPAGGTVLDYGCGPGNSTRVLLDAGFRVVATDASAEMARVAKDQNNVDVRIEPFEALNDVGTYHGIWANFSLLHLQKSQLPAILELMHRALKPDGTLHMGMKLGTGENRDALGRFYAYYSEDELNDLLQTAGFTPSFTRIGEAPGLSGQVSPFIILRCHA